MLRVYSKGFLKNVRIEELLHWPFFVLTRRFVKNKGNNYI
jgi:hypothetical protein